MLEKIFGKGGAACCILAILLAQGLWFMNDYGIPHPALVPRLSNYCTQGNTTIHISLDEAMFEDWSIVDCERHIEGYAWEIHWLQLKMRLPPEIVVAKSLSSSHQSLYPSNARSI